MIDRQRQSLSMVPVRRMSGKIEMREALCNRRCVCCVCVCVCVNGVAVFLRGSIKCKLQILLLSVLLFHDH
jgi:hypothetical protein